jgi:hypothetical protein
MTQRTRRKIDAALKAKIALEALLRRNVFPFRLFEQEWPL